MLNDIECAAENCTRNSSNVLQWRLGRIFFANVSRCKIATPPPRRDELGFTIQTCHTRKWLRKIKKSDDLRNFYLPHDIVIVGIVGVL